MHGTGGITPIGPFSEGELLIILLIINTDSDGPGQATPTS